MIVLVRHGETAANAEGRLLGRADPPLTDAGRRQAAAVAAALARGAAAGAAGGAAGGAVPIVVSSPLLRARETAAVIAARWGVGVRVDERLVELDYGEWDGRRWAEVAPELERWRADPACGPPGGESLRAVRDRMAAFCTDALAETGIVVGVSHVSPIKAAVCWALGAPDELAWRMHLGLGSLTRIGGRGGESYLASFNEAPPAVGE